MTLLNTYLLENYKSIFRWGTHDCMTFVNGWVFRLRGKGFYDPELFPYRTERSAAAAYRRYCAHMGYETFEDFFDVEFLRVDYVPPDGAIVARRLSEDSATGSRMGLMSGRNVAFVGDENLLFLPHDLETDRSWIV